MITYIMFLLINSVSYTENDYIQKILEADITKQEIIFKKAIEKYPDSYQLYLNMGFTKLKNKEYNLAYKYYHKSYKIYPDLNSLYGITYSLLELKKYNKLIEILNKSKLEKKIKKDKILISRWSLAYLMVKNYRKSINIADMGLKTDKNLNNLRLNKAYSLYYLGKKDKALKEFRRIKKINPKYKKTEIDNMIILLNTKLLYINVGGFYGELFYKDHPNKNELEYFGINGAIFYENYNLKLNYSKLSSDKDYKEDNFGIGFGINNKKYSANLFLRYINSSVIDSTIPYFDFSYKFIFFTLSNATILSFYEKSKTIYQSTFYLTLTDILSKKIIPWIGLGYKYSKLDIIQNLFAEVGFYFDLSKIIDMNINFRYNEGIYYVGYGNTPNNSFENIRWSLDLSAPITISNFIITPSFNYSSIELQFKNRETKSKDANSINFNVSVNYNF